MMKKLITLISILFILDITIAQTPRFECVSCTNNDVDFSKFASGIGSSNIATGLRTFVGGTNSSALGDYSFAFGDYARAEGLSSIALGRGSLASGMYSVAIGRESLVNSNGAFSVGYMNIANADFSFIFGKYLKSNASDAIIIGVGTPDYLINGESNSLMVGFNSNIPTLFVGQSRGIGTTGKIGIGNITSPTAKLHIRADADSMATLRLEPGGSNVSRIYFSNSNDYFVQAANNQNMIFHTPSGKNFSFNIGSVGIGVSSPTQKLEVAGNIKTSSNGYLITDKVQASGTTGLSLYGTTGAGIIVLNSGNVGIGVSTPTQKLVVAGNILQNGAYYIGTEKVKAINSNGLKLFNSNSQGITINSIGSVGINTTTPSTALDVNGKTKTNQLQIYNEVPIGSTTVSEGYILSSTDDIGNTAWVPQESINDGDWIKDGDNVYHLPGNVGIGTETPSRLLSLYKNNPAENLGISFQNGNSTKYWIGHNIANDYFFIGGTGGATPEMGAINIMNGNVGIGTNAPSKALDVNGDINLTGNFYKYGQLLDFYLWEENTDKIYYNQGNVGIGISNPLAKLHISSDITNANAEFFKVENSGQEGSGKTIIGKKYNGGPEFIQQAGTTNFSNQGSTLSFFQKSSNGDVGLGISTYTAIDGTVRWVDMYAETSNFYVRTEEDLILQSRTGNLLLETNDGSQYVHINSNGQVGIGTQTHIDNSFTKLTVAGRIHAKEVKVTANAGGADFVFNNNYILPNIKEIDKFIHTNKHLPDIPSAEEMQQNGIDLGEMQIKLLQKIEELTLYVIELKKENEEMKVAINKLKEN